MPKTKLYPLWTNVNTRLLRTQHGILFNDALVCLVISTEFIKHQICSLPVEFHNPPMHGFVAGRRSRPSLRAATRLPPLHAAWECLARGRRGSPAPPRPRLFVSSSIGASATELQAEAVGPMGQYNAWHRTLRSAYTHTLHEVQDT